MANYDSGTTYDSGLFYDAVMPITPNKRMAKVKLNLDRLSIADLLLRAADIKTKMTGNANYTTPIPPLAQLTSQITALTTSNAAYSAGELTQKQNKTTRDTDAAALVNTLTLLGNYVEAASGGDAAKIQSAGMGVKASNATTTIPDPVANLSLTAGDNAGELDAQWDPISPVKTYEVQVCPDPITPTGWVSQGSVSKSKIAIMGLTSGARMWVRVRATNAAGTGAWSDVASKIVP
jgi:hypothetical protein